MEIVKIPLNAGALSKKKGLEKGPDEIIKSLDNLFYIDKNMFSISEISINNSNIDEAHNSIFHFSESLFSQSKKPVFVGGDHSLTYSAFKAFSKHNKNPAIIVFDAHADMEDSKLTHEDYLRNIIEDGLVNPENVFIVGLRNITKTELSYINEKKVNAYFIGSIISKGIKHIISEILQKLKQNNIYVSIDIDCLEPCFALGTGYIEPNGLSLRELLYSISMLKPKAQAFDIVEANPEKDINGITSKTSAVILAEIIK